MMMKSRSGGGAEHEQRLQQQLVIVPLPSHGHYISTLEFAHRLIRAADQRFSVTILRVRSSLDPHPHIYTKSQQATHGHDLIRFIDLPPVDPPPLHLVQESIEHYLLLFFESFVPHVKHAISHHLLTSDDSPPPAALLLDIFSLPMVHVAKDLGIPSYLYFPTGAAFLGLLLYLPSRHARVGTEFDQDSDLDLDHVLPGFLHPVPARVLPEAVSNKHGGYAAYVKLAQMLRETEGIIVNTFVELEPPRAVESIAVDGQIPPVYTVGPVLDVGGQAQPGSDGADHDRIMEWLDGQPEASVVFLCFGSWGSVSETQVREIAIGLERSGHRFLWALRLRGPDGEFRGSGCAEILPEGFVDRTGERGMVCGWAPQMEVLSHRATGGFVSHCGWNSILESLWNGVPIVTWPLYAEQQLNAFRLVKELGLALELRLDYRQGRGDVVRAEEMEVAVKGLMEEGDDSSRVRKKVKEMREMSRKALMEGGSSSISLNRLIDDILAHRRQPPPR